MKHKVAIYGAQMVAVSVYYAIKTLYPEIEVVSFVVSSAEGNPAAVDGVLVTPLNQFGRTDIKVLIAVPENFHAEIVEALEAKGIKDYVCMDSVKEAE